MEIYCIVIALFIIGSFVELFSLQEKWFKIFTFSLSLLLIICLLVIASIRDGIGFDFYAYKEFYNDLRALGESTNEMEFGYTYLNIISPNFQFLLFIMSFLILNFLIRYINTNSKLIILSLFFFYTIHFLTGNIGQHRNCLALVLVLYGLKFRAKRSFYLWIILAMLFHTTAIIAVVYKFIPNYLLSIKQIVVLLLLLFAVNYCVVYVIGQFFVGNNNFIIQKVFHYTANSQVNISILFLLYRVIIISLVFFVSIKNSTLVSPFMLNALIIGLIIYVSMSSFPQFSGRLSLYFNAVDIVVIPNCIYHLRKQKCGLLFFLFFLFANSILFFSVLLNNCNEYLPYKTIY